MKFQQWRNIGRQILGLDTADPQQVSLFFLSIVGYVIATLLVLIYQLLSVGGFSALREPFSGLQLVLTLGFLAALALVGRAMVVTSSEDFPDAENVVRNLVVVAIVLGVLWGGVGHIAADALQTVFLVHMLLGYPVVALGLLLWIRLYILLQDLIALRYPNWRWIVHSLFGIFVAVHWMRSVFQLEFLDSVAVLVAAAFYGVNVLAWWRLPWLAALSQKRRIHFVWQLLIVLIALSVARSVSDTAFATIVHQLFPAGTPVFTLLFIAAVLWILRLEIGILLLLPAGRLLELRTKEVETLTTLTKTLSKEFDIQKVSELVTRAIPEISRANAAWITTTDHREHIVAYGLLPEHIRPFLESEVLQRRIAHNQQGVLYIRDLAADTELATLFAQVGSYCRSILVIPLRSGEAQLQGYLWVVSQEPMAFRAYDLNLLQSFSESIGIAFERAQLFEEAIQKQRYQQELEVARRIQMRLLPSDLPQIPALQLAAYVSPALEVGGDYYDVVCLQDGRWCLLVGDVSGKGVSAALYMAELKGGVMALAAESRSPLELLHKVHRVLAPTFQQKMFVTLLAVAFSPTTNTLTIARAGHPPLLLWQDRQLRWIQPKGIAIGLLPSEQFVTVMEEVTVPVTAGDAFLLYTDGVLDVYNERGESFGFQRLQRSFYESLAENAQPDASFLVGGVLRRLSTFGQGQAQFDDITLLAGMITSQQEVVAENSQTKSECHYGEASL